MYLRLCASGLLLAGVVLAADSLIVLNKEDATLVIVDPASGQIRGKVPTGESPHEVAVSTDGKMAFVANYGSRTPGRTISVIDLTSQKELRRVDLGALGRPHGIAFADGKVYLTAEANKMIARYDPATNQIDWMLGTGQNSTHMVLPSPDGKYLFTANIGSDTITLIEKSGTFNETVIPVGKGPEGFDLSPDGRELWAAHSRDGGVSVIDIASRKVVQTIPLGTKRSNRLKFSPDGKSVLVSDMEAGELRLIDTATRKETQRKAIGKNPEGILMAPDGRHAYVALTGENAIVLVDLANLSTVKRIEPGRGPDGMAWAVSH